MLSGKICCGQQSLKYVRNGEILVLVPGKSVKEYVSSDNGEKNNTTKFLYFHL